MSDFSKVWTLSRQRLEDAISDLNDVQLRWNIHDGSLSIAQMAVHVAGVEVSFTSQLLGIELDEVGKRLKSAATDGVVNDKPFPFSNSELTAQSVQELLSYAKKLLEPVISEASEEILSKEIVSALGPVITGEGAFTRLAFHPAYHHGQAYLVRTTPGFPT